MDGIDSGSLVIVHCANPKEKVWGVLMRLDTVGAVIRGLDINSVEDWIRQERAGRDPGIGPSTFFLPTHRILRIDLEESHGAVEGYGDRFVALCGRDARQALLASQHGEEPADA
jgi:hypothetical protein